MKAVGIIELWEGRLDGTYRISLLTRQKPEIEALKGKTVQFTIEEKKAHRTLDMNAYYWVLLSKLAEAMHMSKPHCHNLMLRRYGQSFTTGGKLAYVVMPDTVEAERKTEESETFHLAPTSQVKEGKDGQMYRTYVLLRGSHDYDTKEMTELIEGLVSECKECGIETATPEELERMTKLYERKNKTPAV